ncbi:hypothetical protein G7Y89_g12249 [Cudoniella acicularis]|uniref:Uncharacterized protein n=1 Tax=Cudoniella acicularis TaxID=354080 RepID=A0A8H4VX74_9HELO|nr:hypothetical protein G7Y89_g12249 [Cudoniella acicularis]
MASIRKSYFLSPSWSLEPAEVSLGSVIANLNCPHKALSAESLSSEIDTTIHIVEAKPSSGVVKSSKKWSAGLFSTFIHVITIGGEVSYSSMSTSEVEYSCESMETKRFTPSPAYITKAAGNDSVKAHLKIGGWGAKVFLITGVKTVQGVTITTTEEKGQDTKVQIGVEIPTAQLTVGPKITYNPSTSQTHATTTAGPIVFAFEVEKLRVNRKGQATSRKFVDGAMLGRKDGVQYVIERAGNDIDEDEMEDFGLEAFSGHEDETGVECQIIVPSTE